MVNVMLDTLRELCLINGISGDEGRVRDYIISKIKDKRESLKQKEKKSTSYVLYGIYHMGTPI